MGSSRIGVVGAATSALLFLSLGLRRHGRGARRERWPRGRRRGAVVGGVGAVVGGATGATGGIVLGESVDENDEATD